VSVRTSIVRSASCFSASGGARKRSSLDGMRREEYRQSKGGTQSTLHGIDRGSGSAEPTRVPHAAGKRLIPARLISANQVSRRTKGRARPDFDRSAGRTHSHGFSPKSLMFRRIRVSIARDIEMAITLLK
jgi:hypothetical protein